MVRTICILLLSLLLEGCTRASVQEPVTLTFLEEWSNKTFSEAREQELRQFTQETGIRVSLLPSPDRKSTRLNSSHGYISYAVFCLKKKNSRIIRTCSGKSSASDAVLALACSSLSGTDPSGTFSCRIAQHHRLVTSISTVVLPPDL